MKKIVASLLLLSGASLSYAQYPSDFSLENLENSYIQSKKCETLCGTTLGLKISNVDLSKGLVDFEIPLSASQLTMVELPFDINSFNWSSFSLNGKTTNAVSILNNKIYVAVPNGIHSLNIKAYLKPNSFKVGLISDPKNFENNSGKSVKFEKIGNSFFLEFEKKQEVLQQSETEEVKVQESVKDIWDKTIYSINREIYLAEKWKMKTTVYPLLQVPKNKITNLNVKLLEGESPLNSELEVVDGNIKISLGNGNISWESNLTPVDKLVLENTDKNNLENWTIYNENNWLYSHKGLSPISSNSSGKYKTINTWTMWPNEKVVLELALPKLIEGQETNVENFSIQTKRGNEPLVYDASFNINTSVGGRYIVNFEDKETESVQVFVNGVMIEDKIKEGVLALDLLAGKNQVKVTFKANKESFYQVAPNIKFETPVTNASFKDDLKDRWVLYAGGGDIRPIVLLWGIIATLVLVAGILTKTTKTPLGFLSWLLLLLGLSQTALVSVVIIVAWIVAFSFRDKLLDYCKSESGFNVARFNRLQTGLGALTGIGLLTLISMVAVGLLQKPEIFITGFQSGANQLYWYVQSWNGVDKNPYVISLPLSVYHAMMLVWGVWLAFSLMSWLKWMWQEYSKGGYWMKEETPKITDKENVIVENKED